MNKQQIILTAQTYCDSSFEAIRNTNMNRHGNAFTYSAWSNMSTLIKKS